MKIKRTIFLILTIIAFTMKSAVSQDVHIDDHTVNIGGIDQKILLIGYDTSKPLILYLHGHGMPMSLFAHEIYSDENSQLHKDYMVAYWDQRGSGRTYSKKTDPKTMTIDQFVTDAYEVVQFLKKEYNREKIYLIGSSWGSIIGMKLIKEHPEDFIAFASEGQAANYAASISDLHNYAKENAENDQNKKAIKQLNKLTIPTKDTPAKEIMNFNDVSNKWAVHYLLQEYPGVDLIEVFKASMKTSPYYRKFSEKMNLLKGMRFTQYHTLNELMETNLTNEIQSVDIPVYFLIGKYDFLTPGSKIFFDQLKAPDKEFILFENSGHVPSLDESEKYEAELLRVFGSHMISEE